MAQDGRLGRHEHQQAFFKAGVAHATFTYKFTANA